MDIPSPHNPSISDLIPHLQKFTTTIDDFEFVIAITKEYTGKLDTEFTIAAVKRLVSFERESRNVISDKNSHPEAENFLTHMLQPTLKLLSVAIKRALDGDMYDLQNRLEELRQQGITLTSILSRRKSRKNYDAVDRNEGSNPRSPMSLSLPDDPTTVPTTKRDLMVKGLSTSALMPRPDLFRRAQPRTLTTDNLHQSPTSSLSSPTRPLLSPTSPTPYSLSLMDISKKSSDDPLSLSPYRGGSLSRYPLSEVNETIVRKKKPKGSPGDSKKSGNSWKFPKTSSSEGSIPELSNQEGETHAAKPVTARGPRERSASSSVGKKAMVHSSKKKSRKPKSRMSPVHGDPAKWPCPRENCGNFTSEFFNYCCCCGFPRDPKFLYNSKIERLDKRIHWPSVDDRLALLIKSGDVTGIQWMINKGWPINYRVQDAQGTCYDASDLAKKYNQSEVRDFFLNLEKTGPPRQKITLYIDEDPADFIIANSPEDFVLFKREVEEYFKIPDVKFCEMGSPKSARVPLEWFELKVDQKYTVYCWSVK